MPGPYYFAWVNHTEDFDDVAHAREDESVFGFVIEHEEGDFATLELDIRNPRVGLLNPDRKQWAYLSYDRGFPDGPADIRPLFFGRIVGVPPELQDEVITLSFVARPSDYNDQKIALAEGLKFRPYWDPIFFDAETRDNPDNVLESRSALWHIDRVTHEVSVSDILIGEDGLITLGEAQVFYDSLHINYGQTPLTRVDVTASVAWEQMAQGSVDISSKLGFGSPTTILTYTGDGLIKDWPKTGANLQGGWNVAEGSATRIDGIGQAIWGYGLRNVGGANGPGANPFGRSYIASEEWHDVIVPEWAEASSFSVVGGGSGLSTSFPAHILGVPRWRVLPVLRVGFDVSRRKSETLVMSLVADVQPILTDAGDDAIEEIAFQSSEIVSAVDPGNADSGDMRAPIGQVSARAYFATDRGEQSIEYMICVMRAHLLARARCVEISFEVPFNEGIDLDLSCRKSIYLTDYRIPGESASGKIMNYRLALDGDSGTPACEITIGASAGRGGTITQVPGDPTYVEDGVLEPGIQQYINQLQMPIAGEVAYSSINGQTPNDDGVDFNLLTADNIVLGVTKTGAYTDQEAAMGDRADEPNTVFDRLKLVPTVLEIQLINLEGGPFETLLAVDTTLLQVPKTIDLEAGITS